MNQFWQTLYEHRFTVGGTAWLLISSGIVSMPNPDEPFKFYPWFYRWAHQLLNLKQAPRTTSTPN